MSSALSHAGFADLHEEALGSFRRHLRKCLSQAVTLEEIPAAKTPNAHQLEAETLMTILTGFQVLGVLSPKQHTKDMIWSMVESFITRLAAG